MSTRGKLITLEGVDGAGKSTHLQFIADWLKNDGRLVLVTREPGGTELAEKLRSVILTEPMEPVAETFLIFAARADHVTRVIRPALEAGKWVVCDRFTDATIAYQGAGKGVSLDLIGRLGQAAHGGLTPDRTFVFDCSYEVSKKRLAATGKALDRFEREDHAFFDRVRTAYLARARAEPKRVRVIDASVEPAEIQKVLERQFGF